MTLVASRIVIDFSYVMRINHEIHFAWKAKSKHNLVDVMLQCHVSNDAHRLNCHEMSGKRFHGLVTVY